VSNFFKEKGPLSHTLQIPLRFRDVANQTYASISDTFILQVPFILTEKAERDFIVLAKEDSTDCSFDVPFSKFSAIFNTPWATSSEAEWDGHYCEPSSMQLQIGIG